VLWLLPLQVDCIDVIYVLLHVLLHPCLTYEVSDTDITVIIGEAMFLLHVLLNPLFTSDVCVTVILGLTCLLHVFLLHVLLHSLLTSKAYATVITVITGWRCSPQSVHVACASPFSTHIQILCHSRYTQTCTPCNPAACPSPNSPHFKSSCHSHHNYHTSSHPPLHDLWLLNPCVSLCHSHYIWAVLLHVFMLQVFRHPCLTLAGCAQSLQISQVKVSFSKRSCCMWFSVLATLWKFVTQPSHMKQNW
jgi:hypothetical protein